MPFNEKQSAELMEVVSGSRSRQDGSVKVRGLSKPVMKYLTRMSGLLLKLDGRYFARKPGTLNNRAEYLNPDWRDLPLEVVFHAIASAFDPSGHCGHSIVGRKKIWDALNLFVEKPKREEEIVRLLCELDAHGFIYFQFAGDVWCIEIRKDHQRERMAG
jgi:hypothetical protein